MSYESRNPATEELLAAYPTATGQEIESALARATDAFGSWRAQSFGERAARMSKLAVLLEEQAVTLGQQMAEEMGKPHKEGESEAKKCAWVCRTYAEHAEDFLRPVPHTSDGSEAFVRYDPIGPVFAIMPWNFPYWQVFRFVAPTLMAGNVALLKHAPNCPTAAKQIATLLQEAGFPSGVFQHLYLTNEQAARVIADPRVAGVTLTGSTQAGQAVASEAGKALKPMVMELGGSDPFVVWDDADLDKAVDAAVFSRCLNNGQSCIAAKRFVLHTAIADRFQERMIEKMRGLTVGDPRKEGVDIGPLARADLRDNLRDQVQRSLDAGATLAYQGEVPEQGFFYPPTVLTAIDPDNPAAREEFFGPVALLFRFSTEDEMLAIANGTSYGLGASLWTQDRARIDRLVPQIEAGNVFVNGIVKSDPRLPFGGTKNSGFGRELGREGILAFVNAKTVWIA